MGGEDGQRIGSVWRLPVRISVEPMVAPSEIISLIFIASVFIGTVASLLIDDAETTLMTSLMAICVGTDIALLGVCASFSGKFESRLSKQGSRDSTTKLAINDMMGRAMYELIDHLDNRIQRVLQLALIFSVSGLTTIVIVSFVEGAFWLKMPALSFVTVGSAWMIFESISYMRIGHLFLKPKMVFPVRDENGQEYIRVAWLTPQEESDS